MLVNDVPDEGCSELGRPWLVEMKNSGMWHLSTRTSYAACMLMTLEKRVETEEDLR
jgi:hypothetical protein